MFDKPDPLFDARDTAIIGLQAAAYDPDLDDDYFMGLVEDYEDITIADSRQFRRFFDEVVSESPEFQDVLAGFCHEVAQLGKEEITGTPNAHRLWANLRGLLTWHAKEQARKELEKDGAPDIYGTDFYSHS